MSWSINGYGEKEVVLAKVEQAKFTNPWPTEQKQFDTVKALIIDTLNNLPTKWLVRVECSGSAHNRGTAEAPDYYNSCKLLIETVHIDR